MEEREVISVANLTRQDLVDFLGLVSKINIVVKTTTYPLDQANRALADLRPANSRPRCLCRE